MRRILVVVLNCVWLLCHAVAAQPGEEARLVAVLRSDAPHAAKEDACRRLKQIGSASAVPALAELLPSDSLYQAASDTLETMPFKEAGDALQAALKSSSGKPKAAIIHALGERRHDPAVSDLAALLKDGDLMISGAAARALGNIGTVEAARALRDQFPAAKALNRSSLVDALLQCASRFASESNRAEATKLFTLLAGSQEEEQVRTAAFIGLFTLDPARSLTLITNALASNDPASCNAALQCSRELKDPKATGAFVDLLLQSTLAKRIALLGLLQQRGDPQAAPAVLQWASDTDAGVRVAAIATLGTLGDAEAIPTLIHSAVSNDEAERKTARRALVDLRRGRVGDALVARLGAANPAEQLELIGALTARTEKSAVTGLMELARSGQDSARRAALTALEKLAEATSIPALVQLLATNQDETLRPFIHRVFESIADRVAETGKPDVSSVIAALQNPSTQTRIALLPVTAWFEDSGMREALRKCALDADARVRETAVRALCNSRDQDLMPDMLKLAGSAEDLNVRALALEGYVRLVRIEGARIPDTTRANQLASAYGVASRPEEKRLVLSALAKVPRPETLALTERAWTEAGVKPEAEIASFQIAKSLMESEPRAQSTLRRLAADAITPTIRSNAQGLLAQYQSGWLCSGPYRQEGMTYQKLFDVVFAPEQSGGKAANWRLIPGTTNSTGARDADLLKAADGEQCAIYLKTRVFASASQPVNLEIGSDDGIKLWVNGALAHANNTARPLVAGQDHAKASLRAGWNDLLVKITQNNAGCGVSVRITDAKGLAIPGLRFAPRETSGN